MPQEAAPKFSNSEEFGIPSTRSNQRAKRSYFSDISREVKCHRHFLKNYLELPFIIPPCIFCIVFIMLPHMVMWSFHFPTVLCLWQSRKFDCVFLQLDALRGLVILVSLDSM